eukprot:TRINITY_DN28423_c0_g1_i1.p1 TRINITY_DN28423_c0_g1~~TRINITY_DN28423_c0_g1_i1.p1  ORF type:complete len:578 (+),score=113.14 TRINITY_DN28423_c0_g1_i1:53-1735(+)
MDDAWWGSMTSQDTPNAGRCWWGWGLVEELKKEPLLASGVKVKPPSVKEAAAWLRTPRIALASLPERLRKLCMDHPFERLLHSRGRDFTDIVDCSRWGVNEPVDLVAFPTSEDDILDLLGFCSRQNIAVVPFGGGSSVVHGVNPPADNEGYAATISVDMKNFDRVLEVDEESMCARVQAGIYGPNLERQLKQWGFTLRYFPQSFEFSTVGGWVVTRGGGHFATGPTHIDDLVESIRLVTPGGITETRRVPASGAGPAEHRLYLGSEGTLGIVTEVWLRVRRPPTLRASATVLFRAATGDDAFLKGAKAVQRVAQSGLQPANLRLIDGIEVARITGEQGLDSAAVLLLGLETSEPSEDLDHQLASALHLCEAAGGELASQIAAAAAAGGERAGLAGKWGAGFMRGGYAFSAAALTGVVLNTFETAVSWDRFFASFHAEVLKTTRAAIKEHCGSGTVTCRFTHVYPDGPAPYYTVLAEGRHSPVDLRCEQWLKVKESAMAAVMKHGGTCTHHHAVGKLHRRHYHSELGAMYRRSLEAVKRVHDPAWVLNPGVLLDTSGRARL